MVISVRKIARWFQMMVLICLFSFVLFKMMEVMQVWIQPVDKYREPRGNSLKVNSDLYPEQIGDDWLGVIMQRLKLFYLTGE